MYVSFTSHFNKPHFIPSYSCSYKKDIYTRNKTPFATYAMVAIHIMVKAKLKYISTYPPNMEIVSVNRPPVRNK